MRALIRASRQAYTRKRTFVLLFAFMFLASLFVLSRLGLVPQAPKKVTVSLSASPLVAGVAAALPIQAATGLPTEITIPAIGLSATVANPATTDAGVLDKDLLSGAVRYPTSALLGEPGNVVIFGHSSYLPVVRNQAYKTFDGIQKLVPGDVITVSSAGRDYTYAVRGVAKESADGAAISLSVEGSVLTLSTCDSFATKSDRFVVTADFVESHPSAAS